MSELKPEPKPEPMNGETGTIVAGSAAGDMSAPAVPVTAAAEIGSPNIASEQEEVAPKPDVPKSDAPEAESEPIINVPTPDVPDPHECPRREAAGQEQVAAFLTTGTVTMPCDGVCGSSVAATCP